MITLDEMRNFSDALDKEYEEEIKPLLTTAKDAIEKVLSTVYNEKFYEMETRNRFGELVFANFSNEAQIALTALGFQERRTDNCRVRTYGVPKTVVGYIGYSENFSTRLWDVLCSGEAFRGKDGNVKRVAKITEIKKRFEAIKKAYRLFFKEEGGRLFKEFADRVNRFHDAVVADDRKQDEELYALFGKKDKPKFLKILIVFEDAD